MNLEAPRDIYARLFKDRILLIGEPIDQTVADIICGGIDELNKGKELISVYINSPGGMVDESFRIIERIQKSKADVATICIGQAAGTAAMILVASKQRFALTGSKISLLPIRGSGKSEAELEGYRIACEAYMKRHSKLKAKELQQAFSVGLDLELDAWMKKGVVTRIINRPQR